MADEQELTPEEKLLNVIQKGDVAEKSAVSSVAGGITIGDEQDVAPVAASGVSGGSPLSLSGINKILVLASMVAIGFSAYEIYANIPKDEVVFSASDLDLSDKGEGFLSASLSNTLDMYHGRRITGIPPAEFIDPSKKPGDGITGWRAYARDNYRVLGTSNVSKQMADGSSKSVVEAIVMDTKLKKMHFLQVDQDIKINDKSVQVVKISDKTVEFMCGEDCQLIGGSGSK